MIDDIYWLVVIFWNFYIWNYINKKDIKNLYNIIIFV